MSTPDHLKPTAVLRVKLATGSTISLNPLGALLAWMKCQQIQRNSKNPLKSGSENKNSFLFSDPQSSKLLPSSIADPQSRCVVNKDFQNRRPTLKIEVASHHRIVRHHTMNDRTSRIKHPRIQNQRTINQSEKEK